MARAGRVECLDGAMKPRLLDLFCKAGGTTKGYQRAGFYVVGVDIEPQPRYCGDEFVLGDALEYVAEHGHEFDAISASPPCQEYSPTRHLRNAVANARGYAINTRAMLIKPVREALIATGKPWIIENVSGSPMPSAIELCGSMFGLPIHRHRWFEASFLVLAPGQCRYMKGFYNVVGGKTRGYGSYASQTRTYVDAKGTTRKGEGHFRRHIGCDALEIDWMTLDEMSEAIPPIYTEWIGKYLLEVVMIA